MTAKSTVKNRPTRTRQYPWIGTNAEIVVLFYKPGIGTVIGEGNHYLLGFHKDDWNMSQFQDFTGGLTMKNED